MRTNPDRAYLAACADDASVERLRAAVEPFDIDRAADLCGVDREDLERVRALVASGRVAVATGTGVSMGPAANAAEWLAWALGSVTGSLDRPGGSLFNPGVLRPQEQRITAHPRSSGRPPASRPELGHQYGEYPATVFPDEIESSSLKALFVLGGNPAVVMPDTERTVNAFRKLRLLVVCDVRSTETTELADVVLPVANLLERADLTSGLEFSLPHPFAQYSPQVVAPLHDSRPMWQVFADLGGRLGLFDPPTVAPDEEAVLASLAKRSRISWSDIKAAEGGIVADNAPDAGWLIPDCLPCGRLDIAPVELVAQLEAWLTQEKSASQRAPALRLINRRLPHQMNTMLRDVPHQRDRKPFPNLLMHPDDASRFGLANGTAVIVASQHGQTEATLEIDPGIRPGVVSLPHGWSQPEVNQLTSGRDDVDPLTGMLRFSGFPVTVTKARWD